MIGAATAFPLVSSSKHTSQLKHYLTTKTSTQLSMSSSKSSSDEVQKAHEAAAAPVDTAAPTIFDKIVAGEIPCNKLYEDDTILAFHDVSPQAPVHFLVIPKYRNGLTQLSKATETHKAMLGHLLYTAAQLGQQECPGGFRIVVNDGKDGSQSVYHLHLHVMGGRQLGWPPG